MITRPPSRRTTWHPLFIRALRMGLARRYFRVDAEFPLSQEPLRLDSVVVRKRRLPQGYRPQVLGVLVDLLGEHTLISLKGATAQLDWRDLLHLKACAALYCIEGRIRHPARVRQVMVAPRLTRSFREQLKRRKGKLVRVAAGTWEARGLDHVTYVIETERVSDHVLHVFSRGFLRDPLGATRQMSDEEKAIVRELCHDVQQLRKDPQVHVRYPDIEEVAMSMEEFAESLLDLLPAEKRLKGLSAQARLEGLSAQARLEGLSAQARLEGLSAQELAQLRTLLDQDLDGVAKPAQAQPAPRPRAQRKRG